ncbi:MAG: hypothetical protein HOA17_02635 [Candidatus Melainabacteria bacterium]|jgi:hypothetical protein|nr:hypothetical protein [Candidatus Melainabacteria bacterium]
MTTVANKVFDHQAFHRKAGDFNKTLPDAKGELLGGSSLIAGGLELLHQSGRRLRDIEQLVAEDVEIKPADSYDLVCSSDALRSSKVNPLTDAQTQLHAAQVKLRQLADLDQADLVKQVNRTSREDFKSHIVNGIGADDMGQTNKAAIRETNELTSFATFLKQTYLDFVRRDVPQIKSLAASLKERVSTVLNRIQG